MYSHLSRANHVIKRLDSKLHVIAVVFNPLRFQSRYNLFSDFSKNTIAAGANLWVIELAFGNRPFEVTDCANPHHIQLRSDHELWHKERMINEAVACLPADWEYVAWVDADLTFVNPDWVHETMQQLQHYQLVQMFTHATDVGPSFEPLETFEGFAFSYRSGRKFPILNNSPKRGQPYYYGGRYWHPGYAWAYRREAWNTMGGLLDINLVGGGDHQMAYGLLGEISQTIPAGTSEQYAKVVKTWEGNAALLKRNVGSVPGTVIHHFHGPKVKRGYNNRWKILTDNQFDPVQDIKADWQRMYMLNTETTNKIKLRDDLRAYFRSRNEDHYLSK